MNEYGVVLAGGGAKGSYQIGVWKALDELGIRIGAVAGTSVGALNGAVMVQGNFNIAYEMWNNIDMQSVIDFEGISFSEGIKPNFKTLASLMKKVLKDKGLDVTPLREILKHNIDEEKIRNSPIDFGLVTFSLSDLKPVMIYKNDIPKGKLVDYLLASACFPVFKTQEIDETKFIDGGVYDNMPIELIAKKGLQNIIVVDVSGIGRVRKINLDGINVIYVKNSEYLGRTLQFQADIAKKNIELGYLDTLKVFGKLAGKKYSFITDESNSDYLTRQLSEEEYKMVISFIINEEQPALNKFTYYRLIRTLRKYVKRRLDDKTVIMAAAEVTAEIFDIDRFCTYYLEDIINKIIEEYSKIKESSIFKSNIKSLVPVLAGKTIPDFKKIDSRHVVSYITSVYNSDAGILKYLKYLASAFPKIYVATMFIILTLQRMQKASIQKELPL